MLQIDYLFAFLSGLVGFFVGLSELASRYRSFSKIFNDVYSLLYLLINFMAAFVVYVIIKQYKVPIGQLEKHHIGIVIFCGLSAMAFLRSSFFSYKDSNGKTIDIGPAALLSIFLKVAETQFDQVLSEENIKKIEAIMKNLDFASAAKDLPLIILAAMRVLSSDEQKQLSDDTLKLVNDSTITQEAKNMAFGLILIKLTGPALLEVSVKYLENIYNTKTKPLMDQISEVKI